MARRRTIQVDKPVFEVILSRTRTEEYRIAFAAKTEDEPSGVADETEARERALATPKVQSDAGWHARDWGEPSVDKVIETAHTETLTVR